MNDLKAKSGGFCINGRRPRVLSLTRVDPSSQVTTIRYCGDAYRVLTGDGKSRTGWEFNLWFKTDGSPDGPPTGPRSSFRAWDVHSQELPMTLRKRWFVLAAVAAIHGAVPVLRLMRGAQPVSPDLVLHEAGFSRTCPLPATSKCPRTATPGSRHCSSAWTPGLDQGDRKWLSPA